MTTGFDQEMTVTLELRDGRAWTGKVFVANLSVDAPPLAFTSALSDSLFYRQVSSEMRWTLELRGMGEVTVMDRGAFVDKVNKLQNAPEWECQFCGAVMSRKKRNCSGCGGWRSFIYDID